MAHSTCPAEFIRDNLLISAHLIEESYRHGVEKLVNLGSSCVYPRLAPQPMPEECLLTGPLEPTSQPYSLAKIAALEMVASYRRQYGLQGISAMPTNLYGPFDNFDPDRSHVLPGLIRKIHQARVQDLPEVVLWGTGTPRREFLHSDDLADALVFLARHYQGDSIVNVGWGTDVSIRELAEKVVDLVGYRGSLVFDVNKPDGHPRKLLDVSRLTSLGWKPSIPLDEGLSSTYAWFVQNYGLGEGPTSSSTSSGVAPR
jgi:GDP-L-fucose synthase